MLEDSASKSNLRTIQYELSNVYLAFFDNLLQIYSPTSFHGKKILLAKQKTQKAIRLIGRALGVGGTVITKRELEELHSLVDEINKARSEFVKYEYVTTEERAKVDELEKETGIKPEDLKLTTNRVQDATKAYAKEAKVRRERVKKEGVGWPERYGGLGIEAAGIYYGIEVAASILGPYGALLSTIGTSPWWIPKVARGAGIVGRGVLRAPGALYRGITTLPGKIGRGVWGLPGKIGRELAGGFGRPQEVPFEEPGIPSEGAIPSIPTIAGVTEGIKQGAFRTRTQRAKEEASEPLFYFFDKRAHKARWTRDVLQVLEKISGKGIGGEGSTTIIPAPVTSLIKGAAMLIPPLVGAYGLWDFFKDVFKGRKEGKNIVDSVLGAASTRMPQPGDTLWDKIKKGWEFILPPVSGATILSALWKSSELKKEKIQGKTQGERLKSFFGPINPVTKLPYSTAEKETLIAEGKWDYGKNMPKAEGVPMFERSELMDIPTPEMRGRMSEETRRFWEEPEAFDKMIKLLEETKELNAQQAASLKGLLEKKVPTQGVTIPTGAIPENPFESVGRDVDLINSGYID